MRLSVILILVGILTMVGGVVYDTLSEHENVEVKCYDRYNNEIQELKCYDSVILNEDDKMIALVLVIIGAVIFTLSMLWWVDEETKECLRLL